MQWRQFPVRVQKICCSLDSSSGDLQWRGPTNQRLLDLWINDCIMYTLCHYHNGWRWWAYTSTHMYENKSALSQIQAMLPRLALLSKRNTWGAPGPPIPVKRTGTAPVRKDFLTKIDKPTTQKIEPLFVNVFESRPSHKTRQWTYGCISKKENSY